MTDPDMADATYVEPITPDMMVKVLERERPDALLPTMGGQTALNTAMDLWHNGVLERLGVELIGARADVIEKAEDRQKFREAMISIGLECPRSHLVRNTAEGTDALEAIGLPAILRPSFTLGGTGGGIAYNRDEYFELLATSLRASPVSEVLIEESVLGWKEFEMEVVRDQADNCIIICSIENIDPMGVHTGDSITVAPALTLTDKEYQIMRDASIACLREIGVDTGGSNVQFAVCPETGRLVMIEMNPRVSRSSALASKATGFPIAKIAAKLAVGYTLDELDNDITEVTPASFEPTIDYIVTKMPRFTFEKFPGAEPVLTTAMKSVGEAMSIGRNFQESVQKALRSMETDLTGFNEIAIEDTGDDRQEALRNALRKPTPDRLLQAAQAFREGLSVEDIHEACRIDPWFLRQIEEIIQAEEMVRRDGLPSDRLGLLRLKQRGFSDARLAELTGLDGAAVATARRNAGVLPTYKRIDTCAAEFPSNTPYMYSAYEGDGLSPPDDEADVSDRDKVIILGGGPNRIGQGIEFDYCCVHAVFALREAGYETIMVNCNPETVSTDYDTSDRLYFEPLTDLFRAADGRRRDRDRSCGTGQRHAEGHHRAIRRPDAAEARQAARSRRHSDPRHRAGRHRPRRGSRTVPEAACRARPEAAAERHGDIACRGGGYRRANRISGSPSPVLCARRTRHGAGLRYGRLAALHGNGGPGVRRPSRTRRPFPERRDRAGRGRARRWRYGSYRRDHGAYRGSRHSFRRQRLLAAAILAGAGDHRGGDPPDRSAGPRAQRRRPDERPVRGQGRRRLSDRGEPAR
jgi:carbamoyl-phosphate synthase large subunit